MRRILFVLFSNQSNHVTQGHLSVLKTPVSVQSSFVRTEEAQNCLFLFPSLKEQRENENMSINPPNLCTRSHRQCHGRLKRPSPRGHFLGSRQRQGNTPQPYLMLRTEGERLTDTDSAIKVQTCHFFTISNFCFAAQNWLEILFF